jgi:AGCS family alanine or glycine:cation symporter
MIFKMAFSIRAVGGGLCGSIVASMMQAMRFGVARGVFSNEAGMGSAAITAAAATTTDPVRQAYINMTGTFWDTIVVCTLTGLVIASSGVLGATTTAKTGTYTWQELSDGSYLSVLYTHTASGEEISTIDLDAYEVDGAPGKETMNLTTLDGKNKLTLTLTEAGENTDAAENPELVGTWEDESGNEYIFSADGSLEYRELVVGSALTISAFSTVLGKPGAWLICIAIALFAFSTILGWEYHGEKAFEYLFGTHRYNIIYRIVFSLVVYLGATTTLTVAWNFSDIANALMAIPNLISMLLLSGVIVEEINRYQVVLEKEKAAKK